MATFFFTWLEGAEAPVVEAFTTAKARDLALGPIGLDEWPRFGKTSGINLELLGHLVQEISIGHRLSEAGFQRVAEFILPYVAVAGRESGRASVIIARVEYSFLNGVWTAKRPSWAMATAIPQPEAEKTCAWLTDWFLDFGAS